MHRIPILHSHATPTWTRRLFTVINDLKPKHSSRIHPGKRNVTKPKSALHELLKPERVTQLTWAYVQLPLNYDEISAKLLKDIGAVIAPTLAVMINQPLWTGVFQDKLIIAMIKKGDESLIENYRLISLSLLILNLFELVVFNQLHEDWDGNNLLLDGQYCFSPLMSTFPK